MDRDIADALYAWREAERQLRHLGDGDRAGLEADIERHRAEFQRLSSDHMIQQIDALKEAEGRRHAATPSTPEFHRAAQDEMAIADDIWESGRVSDEDTPHGT